MRGGHHATTADLVGAIGDVGCFSLHPRKVITTGEGGVVTTNRADLAALIKSVRNHGSTGLPAGADPTRPYTMSTFDNLGFNLRLSDIQSAVGIAQMAEARSRCSPSAAGIALRYTESCRPPDGLICPVRRSGHTYQSYVVRVDGGRARPKRVMDECRGRRYPDAPGHARRPPARLLREQSTGSLPEQFPERLCSRRTPPSPCRFFRA